MTATLLPPLPGRLADHPAGAHPLAYDALFWWISLRGAFHAAATGEDLRVDRYWITYHDRRIRHATGAPLAPRLRGAHPRNRLFAKLAAFAERNRQEPRP